MLKKIIAAILGIPFLLIFLFVLYEFVGYTVNHRETERQTELLENYILENIDDVDAVIDSAFFTGNTSGTGNHTDMMSVLVIKSDNDKKDIETALKKEYKYIEVISGEDFDKDNYPYSKLKLNEIGDTKGIYVVCLIESAPFSDNIEGS